MRDTIRFLQKWNSVVNLKIYHASLSGSNSSSVTYLEFRIDSILKEGWVMTQVKYAYLSICNEQCFVVYTIVISNTSFTAAVFNFLHFCPWIRSSPFIVLFAPKISLPKDPHRNFQKCYIAKRHIIQRLITSCMTIHGLRLVCFRSCGELTRAREQATWFAGDLNTSSSAKTWWLLCGDTRKVEFGFGYFGRLCEQEILRTLWAAARVV